MSAAELVAELDTAKRNVAWLLEHPNGLVDMRGLVAWAGVVERLRERLAVML